MFQVIDYIEKHVELYEKDRRFRQRASFIFRYFFFDARKKNERNGAESLQQTIKLLF